MRDIIVEIYPWETRIAVVENGRLAEVFWANQNESVGNVYKGKVKDILPGLSCVFVDVGLSKNAFLYAGDIKWKSKENALNSIGLLQPGQDIMVQVKKEAFSEKGARVTGNISLPGHYLVLLPFNNDISISRKITDDQRRGQLRDLIQRHKPDELGVILRTACLDSSEEEILAELKRILDLWERIKNRYLNSKAPRMIFEDIDVLDRVLRDYLDSNTSRVIIDEQRIMEKVKNDVADHYGSDFQLLYEPGPLFQIYNLEKDIRRAIRRKVWLKSGGYLIFDETEAMTIIDVNSGKYTGKRDVADTIFRLNSEAALEIPRQLRLRSIGGIVLIDFISMKDSQHEQEIIGIFKKELEKDKANTKIIGMTGLGFLEMTRKKSRYGISEYFSNECHTCSGRGRTMNLFATACEIKRNLSHYDYLESQEIICEVNPFLLKTLQQDEKHLQYLEEQLQKKIRLKNNPNIEAADYKIYSPDHP